MKIQILILFLLTLNLTMCGQESDLKDCCEIKYLDFFGLDQMEIVKWPQSELDKLIKIDFTEERGKSKIKTNFLIPMIVYQLKEYHPNCNAKIDTLYFNNISEMYLKIRDINLLEFQNKTIIDKIDFMRADFYSQVENIHYLPKMKMTFDDGPFYGVDFEGEQEIKPIKIQNTEFGTISVSKVEGKSILTSKNKSGDIIWQKSITGLSDRSLTELYFSENPMEYNSVATVAHMFSGGERLTLYLKNDGSFMYYFYSW
jgi:hypothetical protein